jgi:hypothetical protein
MRTSSGRITQIAAIGSATALVGLGLAAAAHPALAGTLPSNCHAAKNVVTCTYKYTGGEQQFDVPGGVSSVSVTATGAAGGSHVGIPNVGSGGVAGTATATLTVTPGAVLYVEVGGAGTSDNSTGGWNGGSTGGFDGSGGGGASDVRTVACGAPCNPAMPSSLSSRLLVAGGGGGGGWPGDGTLAAGGNGGNAGVAGSMGSADQLGDGGGGGGGPGTSADGGAAGGAGTAISGGFNGDPGNPGSLGQGGSAGYNYNGGGGGGGGYYGGGGAGGGSINSAETEGAGGGGGGGGSSYTPKGGATGIAASTSTKASVVIRYAQRNLVVALHPGGVFHHGGNASLRAVVTEAGALAAGPARLTIRLGSGLTLRSAAGTGWVCGPDGQAEACFHWTTISPGASSTLALRVHIGAKAGTKVTVKASVTWAGSNMSNTTSTQIQIH